MISILGDRILAQRKSSSVPLTKIPSPQFDLAMTLGSGQVFHWEKMDGGFVGVIGDRPAYVGQWEGILKACVGDCKLDCFKQSSLQSIVEQYFALDHPLAEI